VSHLREVILASAGTGKTFNLAGRFLRLLFQGVAPREILATTFTRKAAGEILERILESLANADLDERHLVDLKVSMGRETDESITAEACRNLLSDLVHQLHEFNVRTLDSFFIDTAGAFALDLGLPVGWRIGEEDEYLEMKAEALGDLFSDDTLGELLSLTREVAGLGAPRSVFEGAFEAVLSAHGLALDSRSGSWDALPEHPANPPTATDWQRWKTVIDGLSPITTAKGETFKNDPALRTKLKSLLESNDGEGFLEQTVVQNVHKGVHKYSQSKLPDDWVTFIHELKESCSSLYLLNLARRNRKTHAFLERYHQAFEAKKSERGLYSFEDFNRLLQAGNSFQNSTSSSFPQERSLNHLLLDEFQDTSVPQWGVLKPLVERTLAGDPQETSVFCVGDLKQSIYEWRQGEPRLLKALSKRPGIKQDSLEKSYRSSAVVLDQVNRVFSETRLSMPKIDQEAGIKDACIQWDDQFKEHASEVDLPGQVSLLQLSRKGTADEIRTMSQELTVQTVREIVEQSEDATVGILVRGKKIIPPLLQRLLEENIPASGEGGNPLTDSPAVLALLSLLHLADHPNDTAAAFHVGHSFLKEEWIPGADPRALSLEERVQLALKVKKGIQQWGLGGWVERQKECAQELSAWDLERLTQLVQLGYAFEPRYQTRTTPFVKFVRTKKMERTNTARVQVMTVHASKGLEFDAVILPELHWEIPSSKSNPFFTERVDPEEAFSLVSHRVRNKLKIVSPEINRLYEDAMGDKIREALCVLYVAMTRAKRRLDLIIPHQENSVTSKGVGSGLAFFLRASLCEASEEQDEEADEPLGPLVFQALDPQGRPWFKDLEKDSASTPSPMPQLSLAKSTTKRHLQRVAPSAKPKGAQAVKDLFQDHQGRELGTLIHALFEQVTWLDESPPSEEEQQRALAGLAAPAQQKEKARTLFTEALQKPKIVAALSLGDRNPEELEVRQEWDFRVLRSEEEESSLMHGSMDRVELQTEQGNPVRAHIFDFKSDRIDAAEAKSHAETHRSQMEDYRFALSTLTGISEDAIAISLVFSHPGEVVLL